MITSIFILISISTAAQADRICYDHLGCFPSYTASFMGLPFPIPVPESPEEINARFLLYTRDHPFQVIKATNVSIVRDSSFNPDKEIKVIIHGYRTGDVVTWPSELCQDILEVEDVNCFAVYWEDGAGVIYVQAVSNARVVGAQVANLLASLQEIYNKNLFKDKVHIIGHSLGAHAAAFAGQKAHCCVHRITGLDPAAPLFEGANNDLKLDSSDAEIVDVMYTDMSIYTPQMMFRGLGTNDASGHLNFYPNGGRNQPGCDETPLINIINPSDMEHAVFCSHSRSLQLYKESIHNPAAFLACAASSYQDFQNRAGSPDTEICVRMGHHLNAPTSMTGNFYLKTRGEPPFAADAP